VPVIQATQGSTNRRIIIQVVQGKKQDPLSKITNVKKDGGVVQVAEHLPSKHKTPSLKPRGPPKAKHCF
jgi:hypothetical protein